MAHGPTEGLAPSLHRVCWRGFAQAATIRTASWQSLSPQHIAHGRRAAACSIWPAAGMPPSPALVVWGKGTSFDAIRQLFAVVVCPPTVRSGGCHIKSEWVTSERSGTLLEEGFAGAAMVNRQYPTHLTPVSPPFTHFPLFYSPPPSSPSNPLANVTHRGPGAVVSIIPLIAVYHGTGGPIQHRCRILESEPEEPRGRRRPLSVFSLDESALDTAPARRDHDVRFDLRNVPALSMTLVAPVF